MSAEKSEVDAKSLGTGGDLSLLAAASCAKAANVLAQAQLPFGMFGDFDEAHLFGMMLATVRDEHVQQLRACHIVLAGIAGTAQASADATPANNEPTDPIARER